MDSFCLKKGSMDRQRVHCRWGAFAPRGRELAPESKKACSIQSEWEWEWTRVRAAMTLVEEKVP